MLRKNKMMRRFISRFGLLTSVIIVLFGITLLSNVRGLSCYLKNRPILMRGAILFVRTDTEGRLTNGRCAPPDQVFKIIMHGPNVEDSDLALLQAYTRTNTLILDGIDIKGIGLQNLGVMSCLCRLQVTNFSLAEKLKFFPAFPCLRELNVSGTSLNSGDLSKFPDMPVIEEVNLSNNQINANGIRMFLYRYPTLKNIVLNNTGLTHDDVVRIEREYPHVRCYL